MTQEEKELLFKDLCARIPYGIKCGIAIYKKAFKLLGIIEDQANLNSPIYEEGDDWWQITEIKPYLRPMSSMTEEEKKEYDVFCCELYLGIDETIASNFIDWLNKNYFDYRGLIEKGLALEAPKDMYK